MLHVHSAPNHPQLNLQVTKSRFDVPPPFGGQAHFQTTPAGLPSFHLTAAPYQELAVDEDKVSQAIMYVGQDPSRRVRHTIGTRILQTMHHYPSLTTEQILEACPGSGESYVRNVIHELMVSGLIIRADDNPSGKKASYKLA
jgi:hypothetical protein